MKTWWDYYPIMLFAMFSPLLVCAMPTVIIKGHFLGGGFVREFLINQVSNYMPLESANAYVQAFATASVLKEYFLVLPIALNVSALFSVITLLLFSGLMAFINWTKRSEYQSQRKASKGA